MIFPLWYIAFALFISGGIAIYGSETPQEKVNRFLTQAIIDVLFSIGMYCLIPIAEQSWILLAAAISCLMNLALGKYFWHKAN